MSQSRDYQAGVPVHITFRWNFRLDLFRKERALARYFRKLVARWSVETDVTVFGYAVRSNHVHLILSQDLDDHDPARREGIAPMMRNVLSQLGKKANEAFGHVGRITERTYRSRNLPELKDFLRELSYIHHQDEHHRVPERDPCCSDSAPVYSLEAMDGIVTAIPLIEELCPDGTDEERVAALLELLNRIGEEALALEERAREAAAGETELEGDDVYDCRHPWPAGAARALADTPIVIDADNPEDIAMSVQAELLDIPSDERFGPAYGSCRSTLLRWPTPKFIREDRPPAHVGELIRITVARVG